MKLAFNVADMDTDNDTDFVADILVRIVARMSACCSACHRNNFRKSRIRHVGEDFREDVRVGVGVVEFQLYRIANTTSTELSALNSCLRYILATLWQSWSDASRCWRTINAVTWTLITLRPSRHCHSITA